MAWPLGGMLRLALPQAKLLWGPFVRPTGLPSEPVCGAGGLAPPNHDFLWPCCCCCCCVVLDEEDEEAGRDGEELRSEVPVWASSDRAWELAA